MKLLLLLSIAICSNLFAKDYYYKVEKNDQLGIIFLSLGHIKIWSKNGQVNLFKINFKPQIPKMILEGSILKIKEEDIVFKKNISVTGDFFKFNVKSRTLEQFEKLKMLESVKVEAVVENNSVPVTMKIQDESKESDITHSVSLYSGLGGFFTNDSEKDRSTTSTTFSGLQPMIQLKGIYSNSAFGSIGIDLFAKNILNDKFSFPVNTDYRIKLISKWNFTNLFRITLNHSVITHSYIGKYSDAETSYKLNSNFIGFGVVVPSDSFRLEFFFEKAYRGKTISSESTQEASKGIRFDTELVYPVSEDWRIIPGLNYYQFKQKTTEYSLSVIELRTVLARNFDF